MNIHSLAFKRRRRFYSVLPLLVVPCVTFIFWVLGGGGSSRSHAQTDESGFNTALPEPFLKDGPVDKLAFYEKADRDSAALRDLQKADPYYSGQIASHSLKAESKLLGLPDKKQDFPPNREIEEGINRKLEELKVTLAAKEKKLPVSGVVSTENSGPEQLQDSFTDMERLEKLVASIHEPANIPDPEMAQLDQMLEKVLDIQYPERVGERMVEQSRQELGKVFAVTTLQQETPISCMDCEIRASRPEATEVYLSIGFYGLGDESITSPPGNLIEAVVHETQEIVAGSTVKLRLVNDVFINGVLIPKDEFVYGIAALNGERLQVQIQNIRYGQSLFPVALRVFDLDGLDGIHIPGAITRDAAKQSGDRAIQSVGLTTFDQSIGAQAATAGIELSRNLLSRKVKLIRVTVKAGYQVLLRDDKQVRA